jgi:hypothetical protein
MEKHLELPGAYTRSASAQPLSHDRMPSFTENSGACPWATPSLHLSSNTMQTIAAKVSLVRAPLLRSASVRTFVSSASRWQAVPTQKPALQKEFKIYRWVRATALFWHGICIWTLVSQNPDEPAKKPTLQSYTIDLNQTGPMVSSHAPFPMVSVVN